MELGWLAGFLTMWFLLTYVASTSQEQDEYDISSDDDWMEEDHSLVDMDEEDGQSIVEGDILLPAGLMTQDWTEGTARAVLRGNLWKNGVIYYRFDKSVDAQLRHIIYLAMKQWENPSCLKFKKCVNNYTCMTITSKAKSCSSNVGSVPGGQKLFLGKGCRKLNIVIHELGHAVGFFHEQGRMDRDEYIKIIEDNVKPEKHKQFLKISSNWGAEYDYSSIMHYNSRTFSNDHFGKNTMVSYNPHYQALMGKSKDLSFRDKYRVNKMYSCSDTCPNRYMKCRNGGYLSPHKIKKQTCVCMCPPRIYGALCEIKPINYEYYDVPSCSKNITIPTIIKTPGYPIRHNPPEKCSYWIQAPTGKKVNVKFVDFSFSPRQEGTTGQLKCYYERVEIRYKDFHDGEMYCGEDIKGKNFTSDLNYFIIIINSEENSKGHRGLLAKVTFI